MGLVLVMVMVMGLVPVLVLVPGLGPAGHRQLSNPPQESWLL
jgi:hypothetical protein